METPTKRVRQFWFQCPSCGYTMNYALEVVGGLRAGRFWRPTFICENCHRLAYCANAFTFGALLGVLLAAFGLLFGFVFPGDQLGLSTWLSNILTAVVGIPLAWFTCRLLSRYLAHWEPAR